MAKKIILNKSFGGFDVSEEGYRLYAKKKGLELYKYIICDYDVNKLRYATKDENFIVYYYTKDFGNNVEISNEDNKKYFLYLNNRYREDETLIEVVEELGQKASGRFGNLQIVEIPDNVFYQINEYDGLETICYSENEIFEI